MALVAGNAPGLGHANSFRETKAAYLNTSGCLSKQLFAELSLFSSLRYVPSSRNMLTTISSKFSTFIQLQKSKRGERVVLQSLWFGSEIRCGSSDMLRNNKIVAESSVYLQVQSLASLELQNSRQHDHLEVKIDRNLEQKYRPKTFDDLVGQGSIGKFLKSHANKNFVKPAYLFSGPRGAGKTSAARLFAAAVNCENLKNGNPCGKCRQCRTTAKGNNTDVREIDAATNSGVENVRNLLESVRYAPQSARFKVYIIDECHMLSKEAASALLKTLEEPPSHVVFILVTTDPQKLLDSVVSRCDSYKFKRVGHDDIVSALRNVANKENIVFEETALELLAELSSGSLRDALGMLGSLAIVGEEVTVELVEERFDVVPISQMPSLLATALLPKETERMTSLCRNALQRLEPYQVLMGLVQLILDIFAKDPRLPQRMKQINDTESLNFLLRMAESERGQLYLRRVLSKFREGEAQIRTAPYPHRWLSSILLELPLLDPEEYTPSLPLSPPPYLPRIAQGNGALSDSGILSTSERMLDRVAQKGPPNVNGNSSAIAASPTNRKHSSVSQESHVEEKRADNGVVFSSRETKMSSRAACLEKNVLENVEKAFGGDDIDVAEMEGGDDGVSGVEESHELDHVDSWEKDEAQEEKQEVVLDIESEMDRNEMGLDLWEDESDRTLVTPPAEADDAATDAPLREEAKSIVQNVADTVIVDSALVQEVQDGDHYLSSASEVAGGEAIVAPMSSEEEEAVLMGIQELQDIKSQAEELIQTKSHKSLLKGKGRIVVISQTSVALEFPKGCLQQARKPQTEKSFRRAFSQILGRDMSITFESPAGSGGQTESAEVESTVKRPRRLTSRRAKVGGEEEGGEEEKGGEKKGVEEKRELGARIRSLVEDGGEVGSQESHVTEANGMAGKRKVVRQDANAVRNGPIRRRKETDRFHEQLSDDEAKALWKQTSEVEPERTEEEEKTETSVLIAASSVEKEGKTWRDEIASVKKPSRRPSNASVNNNSNGNRVVNRRLNVSEELEPKDDEPVVPFDTENVKKKMGKKLTGKVNAERRFPPYRSRMETVARNMANSFNGEVLSHSN